MIATTFFVVVFAMFTCWVTWMWGAWAPVVAWVSFLTGMLVNFTVAVEKKQSEAVQRARLRKEAKKGEEGNLMVH